MEAKGLRPGARERAAGHRGQPQGPAPAGGWWNWGGITRPVTLVPRGRVNVADLGLLVDVELPGCRVHLHREGARHRDPLQAAPGEAPRCCGYAAARGSSPGACRPPAHPQGAPALAVRARDAQGPEALRLATSGRREVQGEVPVPAPELWSPERPSLYRATVTLTYRGRVEQVRQTEHRAALGRGQARPAAPEQPPHPAPRRLAPRGHDRPRRRPHRRPTSTRSCASSRSWAPT